MHTTSPTLLEKLREPNQGQAWARFVELYTPLLLAWARRMGLQPHDAADLVQDVLTTLVQQLPKFRYDAHDPKKKSFRGWLRTVCFNKWHDRCRLKRNQMVNADSSELNALPTADGLEQFWEEEHDRFLVRQALKTLKDLRGDLQPQTIEICWELIVNDRPAAAVARQFGVTENKVYLAKLRVMRRLRDELAEFLE